MFDFVSLSGMSNVDLVVPIIITIVVVRGLPQLKLSVRLLRGIRFFIPQYFRKPQQIVSDSKADNDSRDVPIEEAVSKLNFTMQEVDSSKTAFAILSSQACFKLFESLLQVVVAICLSLIFSKVYHCVLPYGLNSVWMALALAVGLSFTYSGLFVTADGNIVLPFAWISFIGFMVVMYSYPKIILSSVALEGLTLHLHALTKQLSSTPPIESYTTLHSGVELLISLALALTVTAVATPARRVAQLLTKMTVGRSFERASTSWMVVLWADYFFSIPLLFLFSGAVTKAVFKSDGNPCDALSQVCLDSSSVAVPEWLATLKVCGLFIFVALKLSVIKKYMQSFLDLSVESVTLAMVSRDSLIVKNLQDLVQVRSNYLMTVVTQAVCIPAMIFFWLLIKLRSLPHSTGLCYFTRHISNADTTSLASIRQEFFVYNSTDVAFRDASMPHFTTALVRAFGKSLFEPVTVSRTPTEREPKSLDLLTAFMNKMSEIYYPPAAISQELIDTAIFWTVAIWFLMTSGFLIRWFLDMQGLRASAAKEVL
eukprot:gene10861-12072_t